MIPEYIGYFLLMFSILTIIDILIKKVSERNIVYNLMSAITWTLFFIFIKNIWLFIIGGSLMVMVNVYCIIKLYPTSDTKYFTRRKKDAVQRPIPGEEKRNQDVTADKDQHLTKDS